LAGQLEAVPIDYTAGNPVAQIQEEQHRRRAGNAWRREEAPGGVTCAIDAVGFQARAYDDASREDRRVVIRDLAEPIGPTGRLAIVGVIPVQDPEGPDELERDGRLDVPWGRLFGKGVTVGMGRDHDERYNDVLRDLIAAGRIRPGDIVSHRLALDAAPDAFERFDARRDGYVKIVLDPRA